MRTSPERAETLVVGGGIGGLAAALALSRQGMAVRVLEQAAEFGEIGAGIQLAPNALRMLERLGIAEARTGARPGSWRSASPASTGTCAPGWR